MLCRTDEHTLRPSRSRPLDPAAGLAARDESGSPAQGREGRGFVSGPLYAAWLACFLLAAEPSRAQSPQIVINEELAANAEALKVKMGSKWSHRVWTISFGEFSVGKGSSQGKQDTSSATTKEATKNNIWQRVSQTKAHYEFTLSDSRSNLATVEAVDDVSVEEFRTVTRTLNFLSPKKWLESEELLPWTKEIYWEPGEDSNKSQVFSAVINTSGEDADTWVLTMAMSEGRDLGYEREAFLSNGERQIQIVSTTSNKPKGVVRANPALGLEFVEGEQTLCALQYSGGGFMSDYKKLVWIDSRLDQRMKLILAAAMTSLLQLPGLGAPI